ncbi:MAG: hypothetical protein AAF215_02930 [Cyanobacteria bacterium P01_A01_bin.123]
MNSNNPLRGFSNHTQAKLDLLHAVLHSKESYLWNPGAADSEAYLTELEATWGEAGLSSEEAAVGWQTLSRQLDIMWQSVDQASAETTDTVVAATLKQQFANRMPADLLAQMAQRAEEIVRSGQPLMQQMIHCVQDVLSAWDETDLQVMARPLTLAMRDGQGEILTVALNSVREANWEDLSAMEQARLGLAIARYALNQADEQA